MKPILTVLLAAIASSIVTTVLAAEITLESAPPVVIHTAPAAGSIAVDPALKELRATFSKPMQDGSWSWVTWQKDQQPEITGTPRFLADGRTCVLPVKLEPNRFYGLWLNDAQASNFKDTGGVPAVPYLLAFKTGAPDPAAAADAALNEDQRAVLAWTDRQFRSYFDQRSFTGWSEQERTDLEVRLRDALKGPENRDFYAAINSLAALGSTNALPDLREIAFDRRDKNNRSRWMAIRALSLLGDKASVPDLIHLVYHGNVNTHWWAQIALVRLTGRNFGPDWAAWGQWWNESGGQPPYNPEIIRWYNGQPEPEKLAETLAESDRKFLGDLRK